MILVFTNKKRELGNTKELFTILLAILNLRIIVSSNICTKNPTPKALIKFVI